MPDEVPFDIPKDVIDLASRLMGAWDELKAVLPAISIESVTPTGTKHLAKTEIAQVRMDGTVVWERALAPGGTVALPKPADIAEVWVKGAQTTPGEVLPGPTPGKPSPSPSPVLKGTPSPMAEFDISRHRVGEFIRLRIASDAPAGSRVYLRIKNLQKDEMDILKVVPQDYPFAGTVPILAESDQVTTNNATLVELTQATGPADAAQYLIYYSIGGWGALLHPPQTIFVY